MSQHHGNNSSATGQRASSVTSSRVVSSNNTAADIISNDDGFRLSWAQEHEVDLSTVLASIQEINAGHEQRLIGVTITSYYNRASLPTFPESLVLNRTHEEPPYPR